jgi:hypothetical protein
MIDEHSSYTSTVRIETSAKSRKVPPPWMAQATVVLIAWQTWGLVDSLRGLRWGRQCKRFQAVDLLLVLLLFSLSNERSVRAFYRHMGPHASLLAALWQRDRLPSRSAFVEMLATVDESFLEVVRPLFCPIWSRAFQLQACTGSSIGPTTPGI